MHAEGPTKASSKFSFIASHVAVQYPLDALHASSRASAAYRQPKYTTLPSVMWTRASHMISDAHYFPSKLITVRMSLLLSGNL